MDRLVGGVFAAAVVAVVLARVMEPITPIHLLLLYLLLAAVACNQYDHRVNESISLRFSVQIVLIYALGILLVALFLGGLGVRTLELGLVFVLVIAFVLLRDDLLGFVRTGLPYFLAFAVVFGVFLYHAQAFPAGSGLGLFPVYAGFLFAVNLFVLPRYVDDGAVLWTVASVAGIAALLGLIVAVRGEFGWWLFEVRTWSGTVSPPGIDQELPIVRSVFANPNTLGLVLFAGTVAAAVMTVRTLGSRWPALAVVPAGLFALNAAVLFLSNSRASMAAATIAVGTYAAAIADRRLLPIATFGIAAAVPVGLVAVHAGPIPIDPANRFTLWRAGLEAVRHDSGLLGQGIVATSEAVEPYLDEGGHAVHNSYLSIAIRAGLLGGVAYLAIVIGPILHSMIRYDRVNAPMLALAIGFAIHQLFESYTLYGLGPGSVIGALALGYVIHSLVAGNRSVKASSEANTDTDTSASDTWPTTDPVRYPGGPNRAGRSEERQ